MNDDGSLLDLDPVVPGATRATVFMSDPSAEAERVAQLLRTAGYVVLDVPMAMLVTRVEVQRPRVIVVDADVNGAAEAVARIRAMADGAGIDVLLLGEARSEGGPRAEALRAEVSGFFARPIDPAALLLKIEALTSGPTSRASTPAAAVASARPPPSLPGWGRTSERRSPVPAPGSFGVAPRSTRSPSLLGYSQDEPLSARASLSIRTSLSTELEALLASAEQRLDSQRLDDLVPPSPEEELEAVLPAELLAALDEPIDEDDEFGEFSLPERAPASSDRDAYANAAAATNAGRALTPPPSRSTLAEAPSVFAPRGVEESTSGLASRAFTDPRVSGEGRSGLATDEDDGFDPGQTALGVRKTLAAPSLLEAAPAGASSNVRQEGSMRPARVPNAPATFLTPGDTPRLLAEAVAARATGSLSFELENALRRIVFRDGDIVTAASSAEDETLLGFMIARGDVRQEQARELLGKIPPFGRHAGAALVGHGFLRQDQLWPALRGHAEWIVGKVALQTRGTARIEGEAPGRLLLEPSVFGGSCGAEVLVEVARRVITPTSAVTRVGGGNARIGEGPTAALLLECALSADDRELLAASHGQTIHEVMSRAPGPEFASLLYMLSLLGVIAVTAPLEAHVLDGPGTRRAEEVPRDGWDESAPEADVLALDLTAVRERVRARYDLVCEADYFTLLGVSRDATAYEVRRAFKELRRAFEPARILTPELHDLEADVRTIVVVLEEAYEILKDSARRERYRRALGDGP